jgi:hypothetical protein
MNDYIFHDLVSSLDASHRAELTWFHNEKGKLIAWKDIPNRNFAKNPKGIYCPSGKKYCLAVKNIIDSQYAEDESSIYITKSGGFYFEYPPEENEKGMEYFTNQKLLINSKSIIPIGFIYQVKKKPNPLYRVLGCALSRYQESTNIFQLYGFDDNGSVRFL